MAAAADPPFFKARAIAQALIYYHRVAHIASFFFTLPQVLQSPL